MAMHPPPWDRTRGGSIQNPKFTVELRKNALEKKIYPRVNF